MTFPIATHRLVLPLDDDSNLIVVVSRRRSLHVALLVGVAIIATGGQMTKMASATGIIRTSFLVRKTGINASWSEGKEGGDGEEGGAPNEGELHNVFLVLDRTGRVSWLSAVIPP